MVHNVPVGTSWAFVRQTIFATAQPVVDSSALREAYALPNGFTDPMLLEHGIADETIPVGPEQYLELLSPTGDASPLHRWLGRRGGSGGYGVAVQVPEMAPIRARATERGVDILIEEMAFGHPIMQLSPRQCGTLLDLDEMPDRAQWFWDDITPGPSPSALVDRVVEIEIGVTEPAVTAALWAYLLDVDQPTDTSVEVGTRITFVPQTSGGIQTVTLRSNAPVADIERLGTTFRHVA